MQTQTKIIILLVLTIAGVGVVSHSGEQPTLPKPEPNIQAIKLEDGEFRTITAYNVGDVAQTDDTPCIGASNLDLCKLLDEGRRVCASNAYPLYSVIYIEGWGECEVLDRMAEKYSDRVDIAFKKSEKIKALIWGKRTRKVFLIK